MPFWKKIVYFVLPGLLLLYAISLVVLSLTVSSDFIEKKVTEYLKDRFETAVEFKNFRIGYWPVLSAQADEFVLESASPSLKLQAQNMRLTFANLRLLMGQFRAAALSFDSAVLQADFGPQSFFAPAEFKDIRFQANHLNQLRRADWNLTASYQDVPQAIHIKARSGILTHMDASSWRNFAIAGEVTLDRFILTQLHKVLRTSIPFAIRDGQLSGTLQFSKSRFDPSLRIESRIAAEHLIYSMKAAEGSLQSPDISLSLRSIWNMDLSEQRLRVEQAVLETPVGRFDIQGMFKLNTGEIRELRLSAPDIQVSNIPQYVLPFHHLIPPRFGFSGTSALELSTEGTWNHLSLDANWDFGSTLLTYGNFFSKPKELPFTALFHLLIEDYNRISGDFSFHLQDMNCKGTVTGLDLNQGTLQMNLISNKFNLDGWEPLIPPLSTFDLGGEVKVLMNYVDETNPEVTGQNILNISLENGFLKREGWPEIKSAGGSLDTSPLATELKKGHLEIGDSKLETDFTFYHLLDHWNFRGNVRSALLETDTLKQVLDKVLTEWPAGAAAPYLVMIRSGMDKFFPRGTQLVNVNLPFQRDKELFKSDPLSIELAEGKIHGALTMKFKETDPSWEFKGGAEEINLDTLLAHASASGVSWISGKFFAQGVVQGKGYEWMSEKNPLIGEGKFSVTKGQLNSLDLLAAIGNIDGFGEVGLLSNKKTEFSDLRGQFKVGENKLKVDSLMLVSSDLLVEGAGESVWGGPLNYRLETYLSTALTTHFLTPILGSRENLRDKQFGPIPLLISGPVSAPEVKPDARRMESLKDQLFRKKTDQILRNFIPESVLESPLDAGEKTRQS